ncbi:acyl-CoA carboxylase subunit beta [Shouchella clausii]|uniref:acyl-CoA carboxylase subunit beta n=1 Tax=Shouchella clausii TaxID=79880 RepID=UPI000BA722F6|nr:acyl-CoA carboxylase subunit beta [Shouchella clausii]PAD43077.1 methylmalonyl-CoA carboxyltransferase [Bacillus sp. 7520-S]PAD91499.1 methylmalonyl-CoA carboxyltransferase [Shouchella clausii]
MERNKRLAAERARLASGGGTKKQQAQKQAGKQTARERIGMLLDRESFTEHLAFASGSGGVAGDGVIVGYGTISGRLVCVYAQDFTVSGGSLGAMHAKKICAIMDLAYDMKAPIIALIDSGGARIQEGAKALAGYGDIFKRNVRYSGAIPQLSVMLGPCAGGAVYSPALTDAIFMVDQMSQMVITGPKVLKAATGAEVKMEDLGGARMHSEKSGVAHFCAKTEAELFVLVRQFLSYLPDNGAKKACHKRVSEKVSAHLPRDSKTVYDMVPIICGLADENSFFEWSKRYARNLITAFIRLDGQPVGVVANNPKHLAGCIDMDASDKCARFVRFCDCFHIPLLVLEDVSGFIPGVEQESRGLIRHGAKIIYAFAEATVPKITVIVRKAYGGAYVALNSKALGADFVYAWPGAEIAVMGPAGAAAVLHQKDIQASNDPAKALLQFEENYREKVADPFYAAKEALIDDVIEPDETRQRLIESFSILACKDDRADWQKKHGNMPL